MVEIINGNGINDKNDFDDNDIRELAICESKVDYRIKLKDIVYIENVCNDTC